MERGFTVIEVLVSALILGIGILGLTLLQVMTVRSATGARALNTGVLVAESLLDRIELEGRLSWLNLTNNGSNAIQPLSTLQYVNQTKLSTPLLFNAKGAPPNSTTTDPADQVAFYTVNLVQTPISTLTSGGLSDFTVTVTFADASQRSGGPTVYRTVNLTRRILHG